MSLLNETKQQSKAKQSKAKQSKAKPKNLTFEWVIYVTYRHIMGKFFKRFSKSNH